MKENFHGNQVTFDSIRSSIRLQGRSLADVNGTIARLLLVTDRRGEGPWSLDHRHVACHAGVGCSAV